MKKVSKPTRAEQIAHGVARSHRDLSSSDLVARVGHVVSTIHDTETEIARLRSELSKYNARLVSDQAELVGLERVLDARR